MLGDLRPGYQFHHYHLLEQIGFGGQGVVWSAEDHRLKDIVAIKFSELLDSEDEQADDEMFERQLGKLLGARHRHILQLYDYGLENQVRYLVSPYIAGGSVFEQLKSGMMTLENTLRVASEVASALDYLHEREIIHRDLKPSNILLDLGIHAYLADFGLARSLSNTTQVLHTGRGTPPYSPPEQHKRFEITTASDIFSFGIVLFELFTGHLPWDGETALGIQQLYSNAELPDPLELNKELPPQLKDVLRRATTADPAQRPSSASYVMDMIYRAFGLDSSAMPNEAPKDRAAARTAESQALFKRELAHWAMDSHQTRLGLTGFALIHLDQQALNQNTARGGLGQFILYHALFFGYHDRYWWSRVADPRARLAVISALLEGRNEVLAARALDYLIKDPAVRLELRDRSANIAASLLDLAARSTNPQLSRRLLVGLQAFIPARADWSQSSLPGEQAKVLGQLSLEDSDIGDQAARLIGHLRFSLAARFAFEHAESGRRIPLLLEIRQAAGSLPALIDGPTRSRVFAAWIIRRLTLEPAQLLTAYLLTLIGATFAVASQVYLTYRLPQFMDVARISDSLEQGLIIGAILSVGVLLTRIVIERFAGRRAFVRIALAALSGAIVFNAAFFVFHVLFINTPPRGYSIPLGSLFIGVVLALSGLTQSRALKMLLSVGGVFVAIVGTWAIHRALATSITEWTPLFQYDYTWTWAQVSGTALLVSLWLGTFANWVRLSPQANRPEVG